MNNINQLIVRTFFLFNYFSCVVFFNNNIVFMSSVIIKS